LPLDDSLSSVYVSNTKVIGENAMTKKSFFRRGFTLIELLVVVVLIAVLTAMVIRVSSMAKRKSNTSKTMAQLQDLRNAIEEYRLQYGLYEGIAGYMTDDIFSQFRNRLTNTMENAVATLPMKDPWGRPYYYSSTNRYSYILFSEGPKTGDTSDDIDSTAGQL